VAYSSIAGEVASEAWPDLRRWLRRAYPPPGSAFGEPPPPPAY